MEFKGPYLQAMRERAPKMFVQLRKSGKMEAHLNEMSARAAEMYDHLTMDEERYQDGLVKDPNARQMAEETVRATLIEFPEDPDQTPVPPIRSAARIS